MVIRPDHRAPARRIKANYCLANITALFYSRPSVFIGGSSPESDQLPVPFPTDSSLFRVGMSN